MLGKDAEEDDGYVRDATVAGGFRDAVIKLLDASPQLDDPSGTCRYDASYQLGQNGTIRTINLCQSNLSLSFLPQGRPLTHVYTILLRLCLHLLGTKDWDLTKRMDQPALCSK